MAIEQLKVREIVKQAVEKKLDIPEFQREFVWDAEQVKKLAESLYRDYPIGSFLLWDSSEYQEAKTAQGTQASQWIVDGQQRTTALCLLLGQKPYWWNDAQEWNKALERYDVMANISGRDLEFALPNPVRRQDPRWVSVRQVLCNERVEDLTPLAQGVADRISKSSGGGSEEMMQLFLRVHGHLQRLWQIRERDIPIVKISHEVEDVAEIFARLNQEGTRVKEADVTLALAAVRNPGWVRDEYLPFRNDLEEKGWDLDAGIFVRTMTGIGKARARLKEVPKDFWSPEHLPNIWKATRETMMEVLKRLAEYGITSVDLLPSKTSLIPLFVLHHHWGGQPEYRFGKALHWFLLANWDGRYSGSAITSLDEDVRAIRDAKDFEEAIENLKAPLRVSQKISQDKSQIISQDEFLKRYDSAGNRFLRPMLYLLLVKRQAKDWVDKTLIGYDKTGAGKITGFEPQWHHIYSRSVLQQAEVPDDEIHCLANITVLNEGTNARKLRAKPPSKYINDFKISEQDLHSHLIPDPFASAASNPSVLSQQWSVERYREFLDARAKLLAQEANKFLQQLEHS